MLQASDSGDGTHRVTSETVPKTVPRESRPWIEETSREKVRRSLAAMVFSGREETGLVWAV